MNLSVALAAFALVATAACAAPSSTVAKAFDHFYNLEYDQSVAAFQQAISENPEDPSRYNHLAQALLYREMFRAGALESELVTGANPFLRRGKLAPSADVEAAFQNAISQAMRLSQIAMDKNPKDTMATYCLGVAYGLRGNWSFLVRKAYLDALKDLTASRKLCNRVLDLDPQFVDAKLVQGVHDYVVGSLPAYMRMIGLLGGFHGDKATGIAALKDVAQNGRINNTDAKIILGVIYRRERNPQEAIALLNDLIPRYPRNYLFCFELAQMWADAGDSKKALAAIDKVEELNKKGVSSYGTLVPEKIAYMRGNIHFWYNDLQLAEKNLGRATSNAKVLDLHTGMMAWIRLGQTYDLLDKRTEAVDAYKQAVSLAPSSELARESRKYIASPYRREKG